MLGSLAHLRISELRGSGFHRPPMFLLPKTRSKDILHPCLTFRKTEWPSSKSL